MVRAFAAVVLTSALAVAALVLAGVIDLDGGGEGIGAGLVGDSDVGVYPGLRSLEQIAGPGGEPRDSGVGVYPTLTPPRLLVFPGAAALIDARRWIDTREGLVAFAVADARGGVSGILPRQRFRSASLTKAMILVAFLRRLETLRKGPTPFEQQSLGYMIRLSDNASSDSIYRRVGDEALRDLARSAGMHDFEIDGDWANATLTAADQARFFRSLDALVPPHFLPLARNLLETVSPLQTWGIPTVARPRWRTFFKGGWRPEAGAEVVHQGALLETGATRIGLAVMTSGNPSMAYGERTIEGVTRRLLAGSDAALLPTTPVGAGAVPGELAPLGDLRGFRPSEPPPLAPLGR